MGQAPPLPPCMWTQLALAPSRAHRGLQGPHGDMAGGDTAGRPAPRPGVAVTQEGPPGPADSVPAAWGQAHKISPSELTPQRTFVIYFNE